MHGKSRYPGLFVEHRDGTRVPAKVPDGCLLVQLTGGRVLAGFHEVLAPDDAAALQSCPYRVSSTVFVHCSPDASLRPLMGDADAYPADETAGQQVQRVLRAINLASS